ncbi:MAG: response regulator [Candidatus Omnitrophica bacterium]|nr:response regulator [Candidatus Omnitrophota bacterium]
MGETLIDILLVEDNLDDIQITKRALKQANIINNLFVVRDGQEALDFLHHQGQYTDPAAVRRPGLILMDINMPKVSGIEVLKKIKENPALRTIPIIMLTVSKREEDIVCSYATGCNSFIQKPVDFDKFVEVVRQIGLYWGVINIPCPDE